MKLPRWRTVDEIRDTERKAIEYIANLPLGTCDLCGGPVRKTSEIVDGLYVLRCQCGSVDKPAPKHGPLIRMMHERDSND